MSVKQAANVLELLEYFARRKAPATLAEISDDLDWPRSSTFNIVATLTSRGYLYEPRARAGYYPSPRWTSILQDIGEADPLPQAVIAMVDKIAAETGETTCISTASGTNAMFLYVRESTQPIRYFAQIGTRVPIHASSAGRALLAQMPRKDRDALYRKITFEHYSDTTPMSIDAIESALRLAAERGHDESNSEFIPDLAGVAVPLSLGGRQLSIVTAGPVSRCLDRRAATADTIHRAIRRFGLNEG